VEVCPVQREPEHRDAGFVVLQVGHCKTVFYQARTAVEKLMNSI
jgi:hypothetical protein